MKFKPILYIKTDIIFGSSGNYEVLNGVYRTDIYGQNLQKYTPQRKEWCKSMRKRE